jgi:hypothetical protein
MAWCLVKYRDNFTFTSPLLVNLKKKIEVQSRSSYLSLNFGVFSRTGLLDVDKIQGRGMADRGMLQPCINISRGTANTPPLFQLTHIYRLSMTNAERHNFESLHLMCFKCSRCRHLFYSGFPHSVHK